MASITPPLILCMPHCDVLGHAGRTLRLAVALRRVLPDHRVEFAGRGHCRAIIEKEGFVFHDIVEYLLEEMKHVVDSAKRHSDIVREVDHIRLFVKEELGLFDRLRPLMVIGDHRYTLFTSTQIARIPFIAITNAFYTRYSSLKLGTPKAFLPVYQHHPKLSLFHPLISVALAPIVPRFIRYLSTIYCAPYNVVRAEYGLKPHLDVFDLYSGDHVLLPDFPDICPTRTLPALYHYVGMFGWSPWGALSQELSRSKDVIYLTMGSTGRPEEFETILAGLVRIDDHPVVITTGPFIRPDVLGSLPEHVKAYQVLPGERVLERAVVAVHHGGMGILGQCLRAGVPMVCIPSNVEQEVMSRQFIMKNRLGLLLERYTLSPDKVEKAVRSLLNDHGYRQRMRIYAQRFEELDPVGTAVQEILKFLEDTQYLEAVRNGQWERL